MEEEEEEEEPRVAQTRSRRLERENGVLQNGGSPLPVLKDLQRVKQLKSTGSSFTQDIPCTDLSANIQRCRECWPGRNRKGVEWPSAPAPCRFLHFRRLSFNRSGGLRMDGYCTEDQVNEEVRGRGLTSSAEPGLDPQASTYILAHVGDQFCDMVSAERQLFARVTEDYDGSVAMKLTVGERDERCDCCHKMLFNFHWLCLRCGFLVCVQCYMAKLGRGATNGTEKSEEGPTWLKCVKGQVHEVKSLRPTQLVSKRALVSLSEAMHNIRRRWIIRANCACVSGRENPSVTTPLPNGLHQESQDTPRETDRALSPSRKVTPDNPAQGPEEPESKYTASAPQSPLHWLADLAMQKTKEEKTEAKPGYMPDTKAPPMCGVFKPAEHPSTLCDLLTTTAGKLRVGSIDAGIAFAPVYSNRCHMGTRSVPSILDDIIASVVEKKIPIGKPAAPRRAAGATFPSQGRPPLPNPTPPETPAANVSHSPHSSSFSKGLFLWLHDAGNKDNWKLIQSSWRRGLPVLVSGPLKATRSGLWSPESLSRCLGEDGGIQVNCRDQRAMPRARGKEFWEGFKSDSKSSKAKAGGGKILRLDYCCSEKEFSQRLPAQFEDLQKHLPIPEYTGNSGRLNLVSRLPAESARAQLGLRVSCAYALTPENCGVGSRNISSQTFDTVNLLAHSEEAQEANETTQKAILKRLEGDNVDAFALRRLTDSGDRLGAVWHIFAAQDTERIREFLLKMSEGAGHSRSQDQGWYLDEHLRRRLKEECGVQSITVLQFQGDAVLIPATALHQVQCLTSCVTVEKAFLSPEHLAHSFGAVQSPRTDSTSPQQPHTLQVRSALYRAVRDTVKTLTSHIPQVSY
ncbi:probable JmjC domain-containing histone demethylation protein 2C isoform X2 [Callorhinchus milii]|uniref:probable JmjC domain-containing histone demethylation protein 2C isoform X2 n=1 Tax=Callorhinchus milii TaxID=7868 RepID=UPI001C3FF374|nr:probable JmjC domain-containing histone demethylation protein 2C isoform X2 [Callorhinchus milii]